MARASAQAGTTSSAARKMAGRYRSYLFLFSVSMAHELTHLFVAYLAKGNDAERCFTPRSVSYANYQQPIGDLGIMGGESGRFLEARLWGGAMEFYQDVKDDNEQTGIPFIYYSNGTAKKVAPEAVNNLLSRLQEMNDVSLETTGQPLTRQQRQEKGLLQLAAPENQGPTLARNMMARVEGPLYNISRAELDRVALQPGYRLRAIRVQ